MKLIMKFFFVVVIMSGSPVSAVMAPWYWIGFPVQLNHDYAGSPQQLIGSHFTFIFDSYHYENGKKYPAGRIMQTNSTVLYWYVYLMPQRSDAPDQNAVAFMEPTGYLLQMLQLPKNTSRIAILAIGDEHSWSKIWMEDRERMRQEFQAKKKRTGLGTAHPE